MIQCNTVLRYSSLLKEFQNEKLQLADNVNCFQFRLLLSTNLKRNYEPSADSTVQIANLKSANFLTAVQSPGFGTEKRN